MKSMYEDEQLKIRKGEDAERFINYFRGYARSGEYKVSLGDRTEKVLVENYDEPYMAKPNVCLVRTNGCIRTEIGINNNVETVNYILDNKNFFESLFIKLRDVIIDIEEVAKKIREVIPLIKKEGYDVEHYFGFRLREIESKASAKEQVYDSMLDVDKFLLERGFPFISFSRYEFLDDDNKEDQFEIEVDPYLELGEGFDCFGIDIEKNAGEFIEYFINNYTDIVEPDCKFNYTTCSIGQLDGYNLWIKNGIIYMQKERRWSAYNWPIDAYAIDSKDDLKKLQKVLEPDIRLINYYLRLPRED